jgi:hypothetical protein
MTKFINALPSIEQVNAHINKFNQQSVNNGFYDDYPTQQSRKSAKFLNSRAMLIGGELSEAYEAYRSGKIDASKEDMDDVIHTSKFKGLEIFSGVYKSFVKGTVAEELADTYIRICCVLGSLNVEYRGEIKNDWIDDCKDVLFFKTSQAILFAFCPHKEKDFHASLLLDAICYLYELAANFNIDLHQHIELKHLYNTTRSYKHGKDF